MAEILGGKRPGIQWGFIGVWVLRGIARQIRFDATSGVLNARNLFRHWVRTKWQKTPKPVRVSGLALWVTGRTLWRAGRYSGRTIRTGAGYGIAEGRTRYREHAELGRLNREYPGRRKHPHYAETLERIRADRRNRLVKHRGEAERNAAQRRDAWRAAKAAARKSSASASAAKSGGRHRAKDADPHSVPQFPAKDGGPFRVEHDGVAYLGYSQANAEQLKAWLQHRHGTSNPVTITRQTPTDVEGQPVKPQDLDELQGDESSQDVAAPPPHDVIYRPHPVPLHPVDEDGSPLEHVTYLYQVFPDRTHGWGCLKSDCHPDLNRPEYATREEALAAGREHEQRHGYAPRRTWDGSPETPAETRFFDLRESGYEGWIDEDGYRAACPSCGQMDCTKSLTEHWQDNNKGELAMTTPTSTGGEVHSIDSLRQTHAMTGQGIAGLADQQSALATQLRAQAVAYEAALGWLSAGNHDPETQAEAAAAQEVLLAAADKAEQIAADLDNAHGTVMAAHDGLERHRSMEEAVASHPGVAERTADYAPS